MGGGGVCVVSTSYSLGWPQTCSTTSMNVMCIVQGTRSGPCACKTSTLLTELLSLLQMIIQSPLNHNWTSNLRTTMPHSLQSSLPTEPLKILLWKTLKWLFLSRFVCSWHGKELNLLMGDTQVMPSHEEQHGENIPEGPARPAVEEGAPVWIYSPLREQQAPCSPNCPLPPRSTGTKLSHPGCFDTWMNYGVAIGNPPTACWASRYAQ